VLYGFNIDYIQFKVADKFEPDIMLEYPELFPHELYIALMQAYELVGELKLEYLLNGN